MNKEDFEEKFKDKGGLEILKEFMENSFTLDFIGDHFGVTKERVAQWIKEIFGEKYDPRETRKEYRITAMVEFGKTVPEEKFKEAYYYTDKYYHDLALSELYVRGIYK